MKKLKLRQWVKDTLVIISMTIFIVVALNVMSYRNHYIEEQTKMTDNLAQISVKNNQ